MSSDNQEFLHRENLQGGFANRNPQFTGDKEADYAKARHRPAPCSDPKGYKCDGLPLFSISN